MVLNYTTGSDDYTKSFKFILGFKSCLSIWAQNPQLINFVIFKSNKNTNLNSLFLIVPKYVMFLNKSKIARLVEYCLLVSLFLFFLLITEYFEF